VPNLRVCCPTAIREFVFEFVAASFSWAQLPLPLTLYWAAAFDVLVIVFFFNPEKISAKKRQS